MSHGRLKVMSGRFQEVTRGKSGVVECERRKQEDNVKAENFGVLSTYWNRMALLVVDRYGDWGREGVQVDLEKVKIGWGVAQVAR